MNAVATSSVTVDPGPGDRLQGPIAAIGAGGLVGARLIESSVLDGGGTVVPVLRQPRGLGRLGRLGIQWRRGDASDPVSLARALEGCHAAVNLTTGDDLRMTEDLASMVEACCRAGVRVLIHLSSAIIHGSVESPSIGDDEAPAGPYVTVYAREKARAESWIRAEAHREGLTLVTLRPGLIWGPRSPWVVLPAQQLLDGTAFLFDNGCGICNLLHVDNLVQAIRTIGHHPNPTGGFFHLSDPQPVTWRHYYEALASEMGTGIESIHPLDSRHYRPSRWERVTKHRDHPWLRVLKQSLPNAAKFRCRWQIERLRSAVRRPAPDSDRPAPRPPAWMKVLQTTRHSLPVDRFATAFGWDAWISFAEGMRRTGAWLRFAGFAAETRRGPEAGRTGNNAGSTGVGSA